MPQEKEQGPFLRASRDIELVKRLGRRSSTAFFNLLAAKLDDSPTRVGIIVGKRFGNAVRRNKAKRVFRHLVQALHPELLPGHGILLFPKREALLQPFVDVKQFLEAAFRRSRLLRPKPE